MDFISSSPGDFNIEEEKVNIKTVRAIRHIESIDSPRVTLIARRRDETSTVCRDVLCLGTTSDPAGQHSGKIPLAVLKVPFAVLVFIVGLWPKGPRVAQHLLVGVGILVNGYILFGGIAVYKVCDRIPEHMANVVSHWLCCGSHHQVNQTRDAIIGDPFRTSLLARTMFGFAQFSSFILMTYSVFVAQKSKGNVLSLSVAMTMLTRKQWIKLNLQILLLSAIWVAFIGWKVSHMEDVVWMKISNFVMLFYVGAPCWVFAVITYALESMIMTCFHDIRVIQEGTMDNAIEIYHQVSSHVIGTVRVLKYWFIIHWTSSGVVFIMNVAIGYKEIERSHLGTNPNEVTFWMFSFAFLCFVLHTFLYPSLRAAALTTTNGDLLERLNFTDRRSWCDNHPLKKRRDMNEFLMFAKQTKCGFRIGRVTFTNGFAWISAFLGMFGLVLKLM